MEKKKVSLNIVSSKSKSKHQGFGSGSINLSNLSCVIIDGEEAYIDLGALHAKSKVEKGIKFVTDKTEVPNGRTCWIVWVAIDHTEEGGYYAGVTAAEMSVDPEARRGWKILANHVNLMDYALKRKIVLEGLSDKEKTLLVNVLKEHNTEWWERSSDELKAALTVG
ncbi:YwhD family protein [Longirhabdus pacifica]|uniref:YwhD family protein n=1 Tax=Longirhabdus pacifica TaxID=2305227 RepID=UPI001008C557|nr:YwhD family protein [Longirhabdus pacifica]